jgi:hypothetical protein
MHVLAIPRYRHVVATNGGLKLTLEPAKARDRRIRCARLTLVPSAGGEAKTLVTDANGHMNFHLEDGDYNLSVLGGPSTEFRVSDHRWTSVRLRLN